MEHSFKIKDNFKLEKKASKVITEDHFIIEKEMIYAGHHIILDLWNVQFDNKVTTLKEIIKECQKSKLGKSWQYSQT